jgi:hypothetical protein
MRSPGSASASQFGNGGPPMIGLALERFVVTETKEEYTSTKST